MHNRREDSAIVKKGLLWQQNDHRKSLTSIFKDKWKQRFFILTNHYLAGFKKAKNKVSEMGLFLFKLSFRDIKSIVFINDCIHINDDLIILWDKDNSLLVEWLNCLNDVKNNWIKKPNLALKRSSLVLDDIKKLNRPTSFSCSLERRSSLCSDLTSPTNLDRSSGPRLSPQSKEIPTFAFQSNLNQYRFKPCPFTLPVSPSLTQRSIYAQQILSPTSFTPTPTYSKIFRHFNKPFFASSSSSSFFFNQLNQPKPPNQSTLKSAASEFSFISINGHRKVSFKKPIDSKESKNVTDLSQPPQLTSSQSLKSPLSSEPQPPPLPPHQQKVTTKVRSRPWSYHMEANNYLNYSLGTSKVSLPLPKNDSNQVIEEVKFGQKRKHRMEKIIENSSKQFN